jgi:hypothetical protein
MFKKKERKKEMKEMKGEKRKETLLHVTALSLEYLCNENSIHVRKVEKSPNCHSFHFASKKVFFFFFQLFQSFFCSVPLSKFFLLRDNKF